MKHRTKTFRKKLLGYFMLFTAVIFILLWLLQTVFLQKFYNGMIIRNTISAADSIESRVSDSGASELLDGISRENSLIIYITDTGGNILYSTDEYRRGHKKAGSDVPRKKDGRGHDAGEMAYRELPDNFGKFLESLEASDSGEAEVTSEQMYFYGRYIEYEGEQVILYMGTMLDAVGSAAKTIRVQLLIVTLISVAAGFVLAWFMSESFSKPVAQLSKKAHELGENTQDNAYREGFCAELDELNATLDRTDKKLRQNREFQNELLANVSHDLRTPLTMIKGYAEMIRDISHEDEAQCAEDVAVIVREADRLTALVNEILEYSELQMTDSLPLTGEADLSTVVSTVTDSFESLYSKDGHTFERSIAEGVRVKGDSSRLMRAVYNLLDNAVRHTGTDKWTGITLTSENGRAVIAIADHGAGIPPEDLDRIWDKYYTARQRDGKGVSGLGLAIVKQIVTHYGGTCRAESAEGSGSVFYIEFQAL